MAKIKRKKL